MSSLAFSIFCGRCYQNISLNSSETGSVLSCGDFLCSSCAPLVANSSNCPACGKQGVRSAFLNESLPDEVKINIMDPTNELEKFHNILSFQIKYYKQIIRRLLGTLEQFDQENQKKKLYIKELEAKVNNLTLESQSQPFFNNHQSVNKQLKASSSFLDINTEYSSNNQFNQSSFQESYSENDRSFSNRKVNRPLELNRPSSNEIMSEPTYFQSLNKRKIERSPSTVSLSDREGESNYRKRIFTPSRTIFSSESRPPTSSPTPSRIRSPYVPIVQSPTSNNNYGGLKSRTVSGYKAGHFSIPPREQQSPITAFMRQSFK